MSCLSRASLTTSSGLAGRDLRVSRRVWRLLLRGRACAHAHLHVWRAGAGFDFARSAVKIKALERMSRENDHECSLRQHKHFPLRTKEMRLPRVQSSSTWRWLQISILLLCLVSCSTTKETWAEASGLQHKFFKVENNSLELTRIFKESFRDQRWAWEESARAEKRDRDAEREKETFRRQRHHQSYNIKLTDKLTRLLVMKSCGCEILRERSWTNWSWSGFHWNFQWNKLCVEHDYVCPRAHAVWWARAARWHAQKAEACPVHVQNHRLRTGQPIKASSFGKFLLARKPFPPSQYRKKSWQRVITQVSVCLFSSNERRLAYTTGSWE